MHLGTVLIAGCGSTGSEILKLLLISDHTFDSITLIDHDTVEYSNLSRQFFFSKEDISKSKSQVLFQKATEFARKINKKIIFHYKHTKLENDDSFYNFIFSCVDNIESRMLLNISNFNHLIDLGVEGNQCHIKKVNRKSEQACLYCIKNLYKNDKLLFCSRKSLERIATRDELISYFMQRNENIEDIVSNFNNVAVIRGIKEITKFDVVGIRDNVVGNVCYINSICASLGLLALQEDYDFVFYSEGKMTKLKIKKDVECIVCSEWNK